MLRLFRDLAVLGLAMVCTELSVSQGFYPLHNGNVWQYYEPPPPSNSYAWTTYSRRDTIMPSGFRYACLQRETSFTNYQRQTGSLVYRYSHPGEVLIYDFSKTTGDTVDSRIENGQPVIVTVLYDRLQNIFGRQRRQWGFYTRYLPGSVYLLQEVTDSIGLTYVQVEGGVSWYLRGAIINGIHYGTITDVNIGSEYRPVEFFRKTILTHSTQQPQSSMISLNLQTSRWWFLMFLAAR